MSAETKAFSQWFYPLAFIGCSAWVIWHGAAYIMAFGGYTDALATRYRQIVLLDYVILRPASVICHWYANRQARQNGVSRLGHI